MTLDKYRRKRPLARTTRGLITLKPVTPTTIQHHQVMSLLLKACPSFKRPWESIVKKRSTRLIYVSFGEFAKHLLQLYQRGNIEEFNDVANVIEALYLHGTDYVISATTGGLLETIRNIWIYHQADPQFFARYLKPVSARHWHSLQADE